MRHHGLVGAMAVALLTWAVPACADTSDEAQFWLTSANSVAVSDTTDLTGDIVIRSRSDSISPGQFFLRGGVRRALGGGVSVQATYSWVASFPSGGGTSVEHRLGETLAFPVVSAGGWQLDGRVGFEQRLRAAGGETGWRVRGRLRLSHDVADHVSVQLSEEMIAAINDTPWGQDAGLSASRLGAALAIGVDDHVTLSPGYTWQRVVVDGAPDRNGHILGLAVITRF